jgi:uncharacterized surface protein with fasciclin (FAS1) repeats
MKLLVLAAAATVATALPQCRSSYEKSVSSWEPSVAYVEDVWQTAFMGPNDDEKRTIYQQLKNQDKFSKLVRLMDYDKEIVSLLDDSNRKITFFAPDNDAIPGRDQGGEHDELGLLNAGPNVLSALYSYIDRNDRRDDDRDHKKMLFGELLHEVLLYHVLPCDMETREIARNSTVATILRAKDGSFDGQRRRMRIDRESTPDSLIINGYAKVKESNIEASNGKINVINRALIPPPSILDGTQLLPQKLSTFTSAVQKVQLENKLQYHLVRDRKSDRDRFEGNPSVTAFVPTNEAWAALPNRLLLYLFSPFGERALTKLIKYHMVPEFHIYTEWIYNVKEERRRRNHHDRFGGDEGNEGFEFEYDFPTMVRGSKLDVYIKKTMQNNDPRSMNIDFEVQGHKVREYDYVARNGAFHVINQVLDPRGKHHEGSSGWEDWEEWMPRWARED